MPDTDTNYTELFGELSGFSLIDYTNGYDNFSLIQANSRLMYADDIARAEGLVDGLDAATAALEAATAAVDTYATENANNLWIDSNAKLLLDTDFAGGETFTYQEVEYDNFDEAFAAYSAIRGDDVYVQAINASLALQEAQLAVDEFTVAPYGQGEDAAIQTDPSTFLMIVSDLDWTPGEPVYLGTVVPGIVQDEEHGVQVEGDPENNHSLFLLPVVEVQVQSAGGWEAFLDNVNSQNQQLQQEAAYDAALSETTALANLDNAGVEFTYVDDTGTEQTTEVDLNVGGVDAFLADPTMRWRFEVNYIGDEQPAPAITTNSIVDGIDSSQYEVIYNGPDGSVSIDVAAHPVLASQIIYERTLNEAGWHADYTPITLNQLNNELGDIVTARLEELERNNLDNPYIRAAAQAHVDTEGVGGTFHVDTATEAQEELGIDDIELRTTPQEASASVAGR